MVVMNQKEFLEIVLSIKDNLYKLAKRYLISNDMAQDTMYLLVNQFNKATQSLFLLDEFQVTKNKYLK
jgi:hypothetical protein